MSKAYPTREEEPMPVITGIVPEGVCFICKRRPTVGGDSKCAECAARLAAK